MSRDSGCPPFAKASEYLNMEFVVVTPLESHPVKSSLKLARLERRLAKFLTAVTFHVLTAPYVAAVGVGSSFQEESALLSATLSAKTNAGSLELRTAHALRGEGLAALASKAALRRRSLPQRGFGAVGFSGFIMS